MVYFELVSRWWILLIVLENGHMYGLIINGSYVKDIVNFVTFLLVSSLFVSEKRVGHSQQSVIHTF